MRRRRPERGRDRDRSRRGLRRAGRGGRAGRASVRGPATGPGPDRHRRPSPAATADGRRAGGGSPSSSATVGEPNIGRPWVRRIRPQTSGSTTTMPTPTSAMKTGWVWSSPAPSGRPAGLVEQGQPRHGQHDHDAAADERLRHARRDPAAEDACPAASRSPAGTRMCQSRPLRAMLEIAAAITSGTACTRSVPTRRSADRPG